MSDLILWSTRAVLLGLLGYNSFVDIRKHEVLLWSLLAGGIWGIGFQIYSAMAAGSWEAVGLLSLLPGVVFICCSLFTKGAVGIGDGLMILVLGLYFQVEKLVILLFISLFLSGIFSLFLIAVRKKNRKYELPFIPFLAVGSLIEMISGGIC